MGVKALLRGNRWYFEMARLRHYRQYKPDPSSTEHQDVLKELVENGIYMKEGFVGPEIVQQLIGELYGPVEQVRQATFTGPNRYWRFVDDGLYRLLGADAISPIAKEWFFEHPLITSVARAYLGDEVTSFQRMVELKPDVGAWGGECLFHFDDWKARFKAFLYLTDVGPNEAPFVYMPTGHVRGEWRRAKELEYFRYGKSGSYGCYFPHEVELIKAKYGFEEKSCAAPAGTLILVDTRGIHRASVLKKNHRLMLGNYFEYRKVQ